MKELSSHRVLRDAFRSEVVTAVDFNCQVLTYAVKVKEIWPDRFLSAKFHAGELPTSKKAPE